MKRDEFFNKIIELIDSENTVNMDTEIENIEEFDSLKALELLSLFMDTFGFQPDIDELRSCKTIKEILELANGKYE